MLQKPRARLFLSVALVGLALLLLPAVASADTVTNNVGNNATVSFPLERSATVSYRIMAKNNDGQKGCNAQDSTSAQLSINVPSGVTATPPSLTFDRCKKFQSVTFTAEAKGVYPVTVTVTDPGSGRYTSSASITLNVLPRTDPDAPVVNVTFPTPDKLSNGWFTTKPVIGTVTASDLVNITKLECTGGTLTGLTGMGTRSVTGSIEVNNEGYNLVTCLGTDEQSHYGAGPGSANSASVPIDTVGPVVLPSPDQEANAAGWYNSPVTVSFDGDDDASGAVSCADPVVYSGPDSATASVTGTCIDDAGNTGTGALSLRYDATAPMVTLTPSRPPNASGWYNQTLTVSASAVDNLSGVSACDAPITYAGPDDAAIVKTMACTDVAGNSGSNSLSFKYDATAPLVTATPDRAPDYKGAYVRPVLITFNGSDPGSGIASCTAPITYGGPAAASTSVSGTCIDNAGNTSDPATFAFKFLKLVLMPLIRR